MAKSSDFEIFLVAIPGLESALLEEAQETEFKGASQVAGGIRFKGNWRDVWRANLELRGASRVLARIGEFRALHLAQLDKRARAFPWSETLRSDVPLRVEASCKRSRIYHSGAAAQRITNAIAATLGAKVTDEADLTLKARIEDDLCTLSIDTSGDLLHRRGHKQATAKAPMRETMASLMLRLCGFDGSEPVVDPMCGSGTFVIEAAEIAAGLLPGRSRSFAFEKLSTFDHVQWDKMRSAAKSHKPSVIFTGSDRDAGAIAAAKANAHRSGVESFTHFERKTLSEIAPPEGPPGLVIVNPPYGTRIGDKTKLQALYASTGKVLSERFGGWRVGLIASDGTLARATGLPFLPRSEPVLHGGLRVYLYQTAALP